MSKQTNTPTLLPLPLDLIHCPHEPVEALSGRLGFVVRHWHMLRAGVSQGCTVAAMKALGLMVACVIGVAACSSGGDDSGGVVVGDVAQDDVAPCASFYGQPTEVVAEHFQSGKPCGRDIGLDTLETFYGGLGSEECVDGTFVYWQDTGWGVTDGTWTEGDGLPPDDILDSCNPDRP